MLAQMLLYEDPKVFVFNKPAGLAVQGGSGVVSPRRCHAGGLAQPEGREAAAGASPRPRHLRRAGGRAHAARRHETRRSLSRSARRRRRIGRWSRACRKKREDRISTWLVKEQTPDGDRVRVAKPRRGGRRPRRVLLSRGRAGGTDPVLAGDGALYRPHPPAARPRRRKSAAPSSAIRNISRPTPTGIFPAASRTGCISTRAASSIPHPDRGTIDVTAPLPPHMRQSWNLIGFDEASAGEREVSAPAATLERRDAIDAVAVGYHAAA